MPTTAPSSATPISRSPPSVLRKAAIVGDALVEVEVAVDDLLDHALDLLVEGEPHVLARVGAGRRVEGGVAVELAHHLIERDAVLRPMWRPKRSFSSAMMRERGSSSSSSSPDPLLVPAGTSTPGRTSRPILPAAVCWIR